MINTLKTRINKSGARAFGLNLPDRLIAMLLSILLIAIQSGAAYGQDEGSTTGTLRGAVTATGSGGLTYSISGASLKLKGRSQVAAAISNDAGEYEFTAFPPGTYTLEVNAEGFKTASKAVTLHAGETSVENIRLEVAQIAESVTVTSGVDGIEKTEASPATTVTNFGGFSNGVGRQYGLKSVIEKK